MKIWIVTGNYCYEGAVVIGVFLSKESAAAFVKIPIQNEHWDWLHIQEWNAEP